MFDDQFEIKVWNKLLIGKSLKICLIFVGLTNTIKCINNFVFLFLEIWNLSTYLSIALWVLLIFGAGFARFMEVTLNCNQSVKGSLYEYNIEHVMMILFSHVNPRKLKDM